MNRLWQIAFLFFILPFGVDAASLYLDPPFAELYRSDAIVTSIRLDVDRESGECVNAFDVTVTYDSAITPIDVSLGRSIVPLWIEYPTINPENQTITMAGGIPNGYCGRVSGDVGLTNILADIIFRLPGTGEITQNPATITFSENTSAYLNDGQGTPAPLQTFQAEYTLNSEVGDTIQDEWSDIIVSDQIGPEPFDITLHEGGPESQGKYYISFNTTDKQSGLSHYEVFEERDFKNNFFSFGAATTPWTQVRSPYILKDQSLRSLIRVKAVDKAGNEYVATLLPSNAGFTATEIILITSAGVSIFLLGIIGWLLWRRRHNRSANKEINNNNYE